jgi:hypothetical protein
LQVADEILDVSGAAHVPAFLLNLRNAAKLEKGGRSGLGRGQPEIDVLLDFVIHVELQLAV